LKYECPKRKSLSFGAFQSNLQWFFLLYINDLLLKVIFVHYFLEGYTKPYTLIMVLMNNAAMAGESYIIGIYIKWLFFTEV